MALLLALALLAFGVSMLSGLDMSTPKLHNVSYDITRNVDVLIQPCGDTVPGPGLPH